MFEALLERLALSLEQSGVPYMVIGGQAVLIYGEPRLTRDLEDVRSIMLKNKEMGVKYLRKWLRQFAVLLKLPLLSKYNALLEENE